MIDTTELVSLTVFFAREAVGRERADDLLREAKRSDGADTTGISGAPAHRRLLADLLTVRRPNPIPPEVLTPLEALLDAENAARGIIDATALPTLADRGASLSGFPIDRVSLWRGDLTRLRAGGIVNAANEQMLGCFVPGHTCIDNAIHAAAGPRLREECAAHMNAQGYPEPTGTATITGAGMLPAATVIHTVGPIVRGTLRAEDHQLLASCYQSILDAAAAHSLSTVGLCSVSTGVFGFPKNEAAEVCLRSVRSWYRLHPESRLHIIISLFAEEDERAYQRALKEMADDA